MNYLNLKILGLEILDNFEVINEYFSHIPLLYHDNENLFNDMQQIFTVRKNMEKTLELMELVITFDYEAEKAI